VIFISSIIVNVHVSRIFELNETQPSEWIMHVCKQI